MRKPAVDYAGITFAGLLPSKRAEAIATWRSAGDEDAAAILARAREIDRKLELLDSAPATKKAPATIAGALRGSRGFASEGPEARSRPPGRSGA